MLADRYELDHEIGRGGMGTVWLGRDTVLRRTVAIKQIGMVSGSGAPDLERSEREARLAARVNHENVVAVFDLVIEDGNQWLIMEHVNGPTLAGLITERGALDPAELAPVVEQVARALAAAHEHDIVHRDVKPSNILLTQSGIAKLADFGIARAHADASLTQTGLITGSAAYLSPEVATGRAATAASDVWSLGAAVFHALAGRPPYEVNDNVLGAMYRIVHEQPPRLEGGGGLAHLVEAMMQHDPDARPSMAEVERAVAGSATTTLPAATQTAEYAAAPTPTTAFSPLATPVLPGDSAAQDRDDDRRGGRTRNLWVAAAVAAVTVAILTFALTTGGDEPAVDNSRPEADSSPSEPPTTQEEPPAEEPPPAEDGPTAEALEDFAIDYVTAASNDPDDGFALLTPGYQQQSGGLEGYESFWGGVSDVDVQTVQGDPESLTVSYTYSYDFEGDRRTEDVTLQLEESADGFLISGTG